MGRSSATFSSGLELANFVVSSELPNHSWAAILNLYREISQQEGLPPSPSVRFKVEQKPNCTIITFLTWPFFSKDYIQEGGGDLISSSTHKETFPLFEFLCTIDNPHVSINKAALELFASIRGSLPYLKSQIDNSKPLIITGNSLGGSVASLFTLSLLEALDFSTTKRPLCITFGSPLIGDDGLQEAISKYPTWNSCFLHVVSNQDPIPRLLISPHNPIGSDSQTNVYKPFGTFLLCSELGCACFEYPQPILGLLKATYLVDLENQSPNQVLELYEETIKRLQRKEICKDYTQVVRWDIVTTSLQANMITQIEAIELWRPQQQQPNKGIDHLITNKGKQKKKSDFKRKQGFNPSKELYDMKICMAYLEWYKMMSKEKKIGYYDNYKNGSHMSDFEITKYKRALNNYWVEMVDEEEKMPSKEGASFRTRWLFAGTNFRRMIEPLEIAEYYKEGHQRDYINQRSKHYKKLEQWLNEMLEKPASGPNYLKKQNVASILTEDSCFWAHVEEALISCKLLSSSELSSDHRDEESSKLIDFENYVYSLMKNYAVSPEIFLQESSFMKWWKEYKKIKGTSYSSLLTNLMKNVKNYDLYAIGDLYVGMKGDEGRVEGKKEEDDWNILKMSMKGDEKRVEERKEEDDRNILKITTFHEPSPLLSSPLPQSPFIPNIPLMDNDKNYKKYTISKFSSGLELANLVVTSDLPYHSWTTISDLYKEIIQQEGLSLSPSPSPFVKFKVYHQPNCTIIAFCTWPAHIKDYVEGGGGGDLISSSTLKESFPLFEFLCTKNNTHVSINKTALELFASIRGSLPYLKSEIDNSKPLITTGNSLGGSVASLFTIALLETFNFSTSKCPLCITFGSPLIGDDGLQEAISNYPTWNSCFLHVVSDQDPIPRVLMSPHNRIGSALQTNVYKPFGTFLLCSEFGCACFEDSRSILELLMTTYSEDPENQNPNQVFEFYGKFLEHLKCKVICKDTTLLVKSNTESLKAGIITQLEATGLVRPQQQQKQRQNIDINTIITKTEKRKKMLAIFEKQVFYPSKELNDIEVHMAKLESYKMVSKENKIGYYDSYKNGSHTIDIDVVKLKRILTCYWENMVDEAEKRPQTIGASLRTHWLFWATNYRRMIEPLDIAEYYNMGLKDYINQGRPEQYIKLEQWLNEVEKLASGPNYLKKQNVAPNLTKDSCFWAHFEEARISCKFLSSTESSIGEKESSKCNLIDFGNYVYNLMKNYAVSLEIFLPQSSFVQWWREYKEILETYCSHLTYLIKDHGS